MHILKGVSQWASVYLKQRDVNEKEWDPRTIIFQCFRICFCIFQWAHDERCVPPRTCVHAKNLAFSSKTIVFSYKRWVISLNLCSPQQTLYLFTKLFRSLRNFVLALKTSVFNEKLCALSEIFIHWQETLYSTEKLCICLHNLCSLIKLHSIKRNACEMLAKYVLRLPMKRCIRL